MAASRVTLSNKSKLLYSMLGLLLLALVASTTVAYLQERSSLMNSVMENQLIRASTTTQRLTSWLQQNLRVVESAAQTLGESDEPIRNNPIYQFFLAQTAHSNQFRYFYFGLESDGYFWSYGWPVPAGYDPRTRPWYQASKNRGSPFITWPYQGYGDEDFYIAMTSPIYHDEKFIGVVSSDVKVDFIGQTLSEIGLDFDGRAFLANPDGKVLISDDGGQIGQPLSEILNIEPGRIPSWDKMAPNQVYESNDYIYSAIVIDHSNWLLVFAIPKEKVTAQVISETVKLLSYFLVIIAVTLVLFYFSNRRILTPVMDLLERDEATGLANKTKFIQRVEANCLQTGARGVVLLISIDDYNRHRAAYTSSITRILRSQIRDRIQDELSQDVQIGLISESRFVAFIPTSESELSRQQEVQLQTLMSRLCRYYSIDGQELNCSFRFGLSLYPDHGTSLEQLIEKAFSVISSSDQRQRGSITLYQPDISLHLSYELQMQNAIQNALRRGEFHLVYQPQYQISSGSFPSVEALLRWNSSEFNRAVSPAEFIDVAESSDLIVSLGNFVIEAALKQFQIWQQSGVGIQRIGINLSPRQLLQEGFFENLMAVVRRYRVSPQRVELEVTETSVLENPEQGMAILTRLKEQGFFIAIDDFGTGYSSLQYLKSLPIDKLKVDRAFIRELPGNPQDLAIVSMIQELADALQLEVLAEGVETADQVKAIEACGYQMIQGFYYAKPMLPNALVEFLELQTEGTAEV